MAGTLSGGEQQMLAIARALMSEPVLLMLDEPSLGLAPKIVGELFTTLRQLRDENITILLVEQNATAALTIADRAYVLENGKIVLSGAAQEVLANPDVKRCTSAGSARMEPQPGVFGVTACFYTLSAAVFSSNQSRKS